MLSYKLKHNSAVHTDGPFTFTVNREIPDNVKKNINYYQDKGSLIFSEGDPNTAEDDKKTDIDNIDLTGKTFEDKKGNTVPIVHSTIDEATKEDAEKNIIEKVNEGG